MFTGNFDNLILDYAALCPTGYRAELVGGKYVCVPVALPQQGTVARTVGDNSNILILAGVGLFVLVMMMSRGKR